MQMSEKRVVAMILAGGQGSRLGVLTGQMAKPVVPFGSRYRIIDFALSNCTNSEINTVGVLTQYQPLALNTYVGNGHPWDLDLSNGGAFILPPYMRSGSSDWYRNTADAIYQNIDFIDSFDPEYVLVLSGDHIYKMNYARLLQHHITKEADATIAVIEVPWEETSRFGIMNTDDADRIVEFEEKPANAKSNLASMGIYAFRWDSLLKYLLLDNRDDTSSHDFGRDVIPRMLNEGCGMYAYRFDGYWKDVGTVYSLWEANMDILDRPAEIGLVDPNWRIYSRNPVKPAHFIAAGSKVINSSMTDGAEVFGTLNHSILSHSVRIEAGAEVVDSVLMPGAVVKSGAKLNKVIVGMYTIVGEGCEIGLHEDPDDYYLNTKLCTGGVTVLNHGLTIAPNTKIAANCMVADFRDRGGPDNAINSYRIWSQTGGTPLRDLSVYA
ncbi:MAG: glucose-1-phosphate adenylyltransferase [Clostridiaceae bacterium]|nr:glucose-1-phosphate adenylyltransferase [Clostridiaceae bacterium]